MEKKLNVEEEKKLIAVATYMEQIADKQLGDISLENKKERLTSVITNLIPSLGISKRSMRINEEKIFEKLDDEILDDIYAQDPLYPNVQNYIEASNNFFLQQEQVSNILCEFIIDIIDNVNDILASTQKKRPTSQQPLDYGEPQLTTEQREALEKNVTSLILYYKHAKDSVKKNIVYKLYGEANTKEKFAIIDNIFEKETGSRELEKYKKSKEASQN